MNRTVILKVLSVIVLLLMPIPHEKASIVNGQLLVCAVPDLFADFSLFNLFILLVSLAGLGFMCSPNRLYTVAGYAFSWCVLMPGFFVWAHSTTYLLMLLYGMLTLGVFAAMTKRVKALRV